MIKQPEATSLVIQDAIGVARRSPAYARGFRLMEQRASDFGSDTAMQLAAIAGYPEARHGLDNRIQAHWLGVWADRTLPEQADEVVIGGGLHAAIYCAGRVAAGYPKPLVLERHRPGGVMACSEGPAFWLNSRNRPGTGGLPGQRQALNWLPGGLIQLSQMPGGEFHDNSALAWAIRLMLCEYADVRKATVKRITPQTQTIILTIENGAGLSARRIFAKRVIDARGLAEPKWKPGPKPSGRVITFTDLMARMDKPWPLKDVRRAAVVGSGDSARNAVEALVGLGPKPPVAWLDTPDRVDVYAERWPRTCQDWRLRERSRYAALGAYLNRRLEGEVCDEDPIETATSGVLEVIREKGVVTDASTVALVNNQTYDLVVMCTGWQDGFCGYPNETMATVPGELAKTYAGRRNLFFRIGPQAVLPFTSSEVARGYTNRSENRVAMFRLVPRTAALAGTLPPVAVL